ncbi:hypothetical protein MMC08_006807 [Hypocenomyce scalaris]|nr:hypothetical protein [Hypocenomyce scalaris]
MTKESTFALTNVRVFDGHRVCEPSTVIINGDKIGTDATDANVIDCQGGVLLPGLIDCHLHLRRYENLEQLCHWGVTTALDMGSWPLDLRKSLRQQAVDQDLTEVWTAGIIATAPWSSHSRIPGLPQEALLTIPDQAAQFVANRVSEGSDYIKMIADIPGPSQALLNALVAAAHEHGKLSVAHATSSGAYAMAQEAKVDILTHAPLDRILDSSAITQMVTEKRVVIPTLLMMQGLAKAGKRHGHNHLYSNAHDTVSALHSANVPIFAGTDGNSGPESPVPHGEGIHDELKLLVDAGLSTVEALRAATIEPAKYFGMNDRGVIEPGRRADLLLIADDPIQDIRATRSIRRVWCRGTEFQRPLIPLSKSYLSS